MFYAIRLNEYILFCLRTLLDVVCRLTSDHKIKILMQVLTVGRKIGANVEYIGLLP